MNNVSATPKKTPVPGDSSSSIIKIAVLAVGGQGGGVLSNWIADLASNAGFHVQATSVAGVAQRTGATIYYLEMAPGDTTSPVFALSPGVGDVDILIAAEMMEAGRAVARGFVTPDRTTLIASSHRVLAVDEKIVPGDGRSRSQPVREVLEEAAKSSVIFDMEAIAQNHGSVVSASLFGGLAKSGALPFDNAEFEKVIQNSGRGVDASLAAFRAALAYSGPAQPPKRSPQFHAVVQGPKKELLAWQALASRVEGFPTDAQKMVMAGLRKTVGYQDADYGREYLDHLEKFRPFDNPDLLNAAAKSTANLMCYDDIIRVADIKTSPVRQEKVKTDQQAGSDPILQTLEYFHPRTEEVISIMPVRIGRWANGNNAAQKVVGLFTSKGRRVRSDRIGGFLLMWVLACLRPLRRRLYRHETETAFLNRSLQRALKAAPANPALAIEVLKCQRLIKGYSDTHARGHSKYDRIMDAVDLLERRPDAADWVRRLRDAALLDENGTALDGAIKTIGTFAEIGTDD